MQRYALWFPDEQKHEVFGYGRVRRRLLAALAHAGFRVLEGGEQPEHVIQVSHFQPFQIQKWKKRWERRPNVHKAILYTTFESTKLPPDYIAAARDFDAVWTTSEWCKRVFEEEFAQAGVDVPVYIVRHGIESGGFPPLKRWARGADEPYTFLWKGQNPNDRKNGDLTIEAFKAAAIPNARMLMKVQPTFNPRGTFFDVDGITFTSDWWDDNEQRCALANADCFIQPTRAEGFGLEPLEAIATCLPTIVTGYSGITDYLYDGAQIWRDNLTELSRNLDPLKFSKDGYPCALAYPLPYTIGGGYYNEESKRLERRVLGGKKTDTGWIDFEVDYGEDAQLSKDDIAEAMVYVHERQEGMRILSELSSRHVHAQWTWHRAVRDVAQALDAMGLLGEVSWMHSDAWLTDVRNLRVPGWHNGPWAHGFEPEATDEQIDPKLVTEL